MKNNIIFVLVVTAIAFVIFPKVWKLLKRFREQFEGDVVKDIPGFISRDKLKTLIKSAYKAQFGKFPTEKVLGEIIANNYPNSAGNQRGDLAVNSTDAASPVVAANPAAGAGEASTADNNLAAGSANPSTASVADSEDNNLAAASALAQNDRLNIEELLKPRTSKAGDVTRSGNAINYENNPRLKSIEGESIPVVGASLPSAKAAAAASAIGNLNGKTPSPNLEVANITFIYAPSLEGRTSLPTQRPMKRKKERDYANYVKQGNTLGPSIVSSIGPPSSRPKRTGITQFPPAIVKDFNSVWSGLK